MHRSILLFSLATLAACGGSEVTPPPPPGDSTLALSIVAGDGQRDTVTAMLPTPVTVQVVQTPSGRLVMTTGLSLRGAAAASATGTPVVGQVVKFVPDSGCGQAAIGVAVTDSLGRAGDRWTLGTRAGLCHLVTIGYDQASGQVVAYDTAQATALPGAVDTAYVAGGVLFAGEQIAVSALAWHAADRFGNAVANPAVTLTPSDGWSVSSGMLVAPDSETAQRQFAVDVAGIASSAWLRVVRDLSATTWATSWGCAFNGGVMDGRGVLVDSARYIGTTTVSYQPFNESVPPVLKFGAPVMAFAGSAIRHMHDGVVDTIPESRNLAPISQAPDSILWSATDAAVRTSDAPLTYDGGSLRCLTGINVVSTTPVRLVAQ